MRVLYIFRSIAVWGGIERILVDKMNYLSDNAGFEVFLLTSDQGNHPVTYKLSDKVHHEDLNICFYRQYQYKWLRRLFIASHMYHRYECLMAVKLKEIHPDLIITTTSDHVNSITKLKGKTPLIVESHSICLRTMSYGKNWLLRQIHRSKLLSGLKKADVIVALTEDDAVEWRHYHPNVIVIPNFLHQHNSPISTQSSSKAIFVGRFDSQKCVQDAIFVWKMVRKNHPKWTLEVFGDGDLRREVLSLASSVDGVNIHQPTEHIFQEYKDCCVLLLTSLYEPFGIVILEAMSCGLPVVAFDSPYGPRELISDKENGFVVKDRNLYMFSNRVCELIENRELRKKMGKAAVHSSMRYNQDSVMPLWLQLFYSLVVDTSKSYIYGSK